MSAIDPSRGRTLRPRLRVARLHAAALPARPEAAALPAQPHAAARPAASPPRQHRLAGRIIAALAVLGAGAHVVALLTHAHDPVLATAMALMTLACLACAVEAWHAPSARGMRMLLAMSAAMALAHVWLVVDPLGGGMGGHAEHFGEAPAPGLASLGELSMAAIIAIELVVAFACALALSRMRGSR